MQVHTVFQPQSSVLSATDLERHLDSTASQTFRLLRDVLLIPNDIPGLPRVLSCICDSVEAYGASLHAPNDMFHLVQRRLRELRSGVLDRLAWPGAQQALSQPLLRRLLPHAAYAAFHSASMLSAEKVAPYLVVLGVEVALCMVNGKRFSKGLANQVRRELLPRLFAGGGGADASQLDKNIAKKMVVAARVFESGGPPGGPKSALGQLFDVKAGFELSRKLKYGAPRQRQALLDHHHQTNLQFRASSRELLERALDGDETAMLTIVAFLAGLTLSTAKGLPLCEVLGEGAVMGLNLSDGTVLTNLARLTPQAAKPGGAKVFREATWVAVKPLPCYLAKLLRELAKKHHAPMTLGDLLPGARCAGRELTCANDNSAVKPSTARFLASAGPAAVGLGIDRLGAALLCNDFSVIPGSKLYYALASREGIWSDANQLFGEMGWGPPSPFVPGLPVGSHIVAEKAAVGRWLIWMTEEVRQAAPGKNCRIERLVALHNTYARFCASVAVWLLAARESSEFRFSSHNLDPEAGYASLTDKRVGIFPGEMWVPLCAPLRQQLALWRAHCHALARRLPKQGVPPSHPLAEYLKAFEHGESVPLFFRVEGRAWHPKPLGSADLAGWWPENCRFTPDFGRHFWETELRNAGVLSSQIDLLMRHVTRDVECHCSTHWAALSEAGSAISSVQEVLLTQLGFCPVRGLSARVKESYDYLDL